MRKIFLLLKLSELSIPWPFSRQPAPNRRLKYRMTMTATITNSQNELTAFISKSFEVCDRLREWVSKPTTSPLLSLAQSHIGKLIVEMRSLGQEILRLSRQASTTCEESQPYPSLVDLKVLLFEALDLLNVCLRNDRDGDDGAINSKFASLFILNACETPATDFPHHQLKTRRQAHELTNLVYRFFGPAATMPNHKWGLWPPASGSEPTDLPNLE